MSDGGTSITQADERCGVDMPPTGRDGYCPCELPAGHSGPHKYNKFFWPQGSNDPGAIFWNVKAKHG
jgi:hypothetical protein